MPDIAYKERFHQIDSLRGLAALSVFYSHLFGAVEFPDQLKFLNATPLHIFWHGEGGVIFFFLLSGFVLSHQLYKTPDLLTSKNAFFYALQRVNRIYPALAIAILVSYFLRLQFPFQPLACDLHSTWIDSVVFCKLNREAMIREVLIIFNEPGDCAVLPQGWTLTIELLISVMLPFIFYPARKNPLLALVFVYYMSQKLDLNDFIILFMAGIVIYLYRVPIRKTMRQLPVVVKVCMLLLGVFLFTYKFYITNEFFLRIMPKLFICDLLPGCALLFIIAFTSQRMEKILLNRFFRFLGRISYSIYLVHFTVILCLSMPVFHVMHPLPLSMNFILFLYYVVMTLIMLAVSSIFYFLVENPLHIRGKNFLNTLYKKLGKNGEFS